MQRSRGSSVETQRTSSVPSTTPSISQATANAMSLFFADATPMLNAMSVSTTKFVNGNENIIGNNITDMLSVMAKVNRSERSSLILAGGAQSGTSDHRPGHFFVRRFARRCWRRPS